MTEEGEAHDGGEGPRAMIFFKLAPKSGRAWDFIIVSSLVIRYSSLRR
jgi:hypothetical protein